MAGKPSALTELQVDEIVEKYNCGFGMKINDLAREYDVKPASVRYRLQQRGVLNTGVTFVKPETVEAPAPDLSALANDPAVKAVLDQLLEARLAEMMAQVSAPVETPAAVPADSTANFANAVNRMFEVLAMQQPGYKKPMAPDEVEARLAGKVEMEALLKKFERLGTPPEWRVGELGFFECVNAIELHEGDEFATYLPPVEDFEPLNDEAEQVKAAQMRWLGGRTPDIGEQVKAAEEASRRPLIMPGALHDQAPKGPVTILKRAADAEEPPRQKRQFGTLVPEPKQVFGGPGAEPVGPNYEAA